MGPLAIAFGEYISLLEAQKRVGTSESCSSTLMNLLSFKTFIGSKKINFCMFFCLDTKEPKSQERNDIQHVSFIRPD